MSGMIERQVIATWYTLDEKRPPEDQDVLVTVSGRYDSATFDHVLKIATYWPDEDAWDIEEFSKAKDVVIHAWCDIEPYGRKGVVQGDG